MSESQREELLWLLSSFFIGEERVTTQFSGLVMAYEDESEESFLTTQQVDEARHMQFFDRYYREVFAFDEVEITQRLARVREHLTDAFVKLFDESLVKAVPGFVEGFTNISRDEHRHVAYGTWYLQSKARDEDYAKRIQDTLTEQLPVAAGVLVPPGYELGDDYTFMGYTSKEQTEFAFTALSRRLKVIGVAMPGVPAEA